MNFNNDSIDDLAVLNCNGTIAVFLGAESGIFRPYSLDFLTDRNITNKCAQSLKVADLNRDGRDDLIFIDSQWNTIRVLLGSPCDGYF